MGIVLLFELSHSTQNMQSYAGVHNCCRPPLLGVRFRGREDTEGNSRYVQFRNTRWLISIALPFPLNQRRTSGSHHISLFSALCDALADHGNHRDSDRSKVGKISSTPLPPTELPRGTHPDLFSQNYALSKSTFPGSRLHQIQHGEEVQ